MNNIVNDSIDYTLMGVNTILAIENIEHWLSIIVLIIQAIWLLVKIIYKIVLKIKQGKPLEELDKDVNEFTDKLQSITQKDGDEQNVDKSDKQE